MAKITKIEVKEKEFQGKKSISYIATLDDGISGFFHPQPVDEFREGDNISYTKQEKKSSKGPYYVLTLTKAQLPLAQPVPLGMTSPPRPEIHVGAGKSKQELKCEAASDMMKICFEAFKKDELDGGQMAIKQRELTMLLWQEYDEAFSAK
jgi:hypothetical protein